ncbi:MAG: tetratricopeptide repeat protein [Rhizobiaceae bacterium]
MLKTKWIALGLGVLLAWSHVHEPAFGEESKRKPIIVPIAGPQLPGPIADPGAEKINPEEAEGAPAARSDLAYGAYQRGYFLTAFELALPRAEIGDPAAQTLIAEILWYGRGLPRDRKKAAEWYRFAANGGGREAQFVYGNLLMQGELIEKNVRQGEALLRSAAEAGHSRAQFNLAQIITARRPTWSGFKRALPFYIAAAEAGIADAQYALANIYAEANGVNFADDVKARSWLKKAAVGGFDAAQVDFGVWLANGRGGKADANQARFWFTRAAVQGNVVAQNRLARIHAFASKSKPDLIRAGAWHIIARRAGHNDSELDRMFQSLPDIDKKRALEAANQLTRGLRRAAKG